MDGLVEKHGYQLAHFYQADEQGSYQRCCNIASSPTKSGLEETDRRKLDSLYQAKE